MRAVLTYHSVDPSGSPISIDADALRRHVEFLSSGRVAVVPLDAILDTPAESDALAITFDDGFVNFEREAWPLFEAHALPVTLFVASRRVGGDNAWGGADAPGIPTLPLLSWEALRRLAARGLDIGSHSRTHAHLPSASEAQLADEIEGSAEDLERELGRRPRSFCYPFGDVDPRSLALVRRSYARACTTDLALLPARPDPWLLPRLDAYYYRDRGRLEAWGRPAFRVHLWLRATARRARQRLAGGGRAEVGPG